MIPKLYDGRNRNFFQWGYEGILEESRKALSKGYTITADCTWSKFMQAAETYQADELRPVELISNSGRPHPFAFSGTYELPVGKAKPWRNTSKELVKGLAARWQLRPCTPSRAARPSTSGTSSSMGTTAPRRMVRRPCSAD